MKKTGIFFLFIALIISINVVSANCAFQRLYWGAGTAVENTDVMINIQVKGDTCQGKIVTLSVKEYDHGLADDPVSIQPASVIIGSNSPPDGSWVFAGGTWKTQWQEDTDHPGETNPPEYYLVGALDGQTFSSQDHLNVLNNQYLNVTKYVAPPQNNSTCIDSDLGINYNVSGGVYGQLINGTNYSYSDVCANSSRLTEWFCSNGVAQSNTGNYCNNGCENGACKINLSNSVDNSTNKTNITVKQEALDAIDKAQQKLQVFKSKVGNYSLFYRQSIENAVDIAGLDQRIADFRRAYNSSNSSVDYRRVINLTNALNIPKSISTTETAKQILFFPDKNVFEPGVIADAAANANYDQNRKEDYKDAIFSWHQDNVELTVDFEEISIADNYGINPLLKAFTINIKEKNEIYGNLHFVMRKLNNLRFDRSYGETDYRNYVHINAVSGTSITFSTTEDVDFVSLPVFISPDLNDLILKPEPPGAKSTKSKWWLYSIIIAIILIIGGLGYFFINKWYKNKYEIHLFKTKNNLFNILSYINNSKRKGMPDIEIRTRLKKSGWTWEQIDYSMKKYYGEKIFMAGKGQRIGKKASDYNLNPRPSSKSIDLKKYNTLSIVAFIFIFLFPLVGLIMGIMALSQIKKTGERGRWMALTSVIAPVILIIIGLVLFMIIFN